MEPSWMPIARSYIGLRELPGAQNAPVIVRWLDELGAWWREDSVSWCGVYVSHCLRSVGLTIPKHWYRARAWIDWGVKLAYPVAGCIVVFERGAGFGHVAFLVGMSHQRPVCLGGNQGDAVNIKVFAPARVLAYRWPAGMPVPMERAPEVSIAGVPVSSAES